MALNADLTWMLLRKNTCFNVKRAGRTFTHEPNNLLNQSSFKHSGLANNKAVGMTASKDNGVVLSLKSKGPNKRRPARSTTSATLNRDFRRVAKTISKDVKAYRPDLEKVALARWTKIYQSQRLASGIRKPKRSRRNQAK